MTGLFRDGTPRIMAQIEDAVAGRNAEDLARAAHALLSSLGPFGAAKARQFTLLLEDFGRRSDFTRAEEVNANLVAEIERVYSALSILRLAPAGVLV